jgi:hypothetical protein
VDTLPKNGDGEVLNGEEGSKASGSTYDPNPEDKVDSIEKVGAMENSAKVGESVKDRADVGSIEAEGQSIKPIESRKNEMTNDNNAHRMEEILAQIQTAQCELNQTKLDIEAQRRSLDKQHQEVIQQQQLLEAQRQSLDQNQERIKEQWQAVETQHREMKDQCQAIEVKHQEMNEQRQAFELQISHIKKELETQILEERQELRQERLEMSKIQSKMTQIYSDFTTLSSQQENMSRGVTEAKNEALCEIRQLTEEAKTRIQICGRLEVEALEGERKGMMMEWNEWMAGVVRDGEKQRIGEVSVEKFANDCEDQMLSSKDVSYSTDKLDEKKVAAASSIINVQTSLASNLLDKASNLLDKENAMPTDGNSPKRGIDADPSKFLHKSHDTSQSLRKTITNSDSDTIQTNSRSKDFYQSGIIGSFLSHSTSSGLVSIDHPFLEEGHASYSEQLHEKQKVDHEAFGSSKRAQTFGRQQDVRFILGYLFSRIKCTEDCQE